MKKAICLCLACMMMALNGGALAANSYLISDSDTRRLTEQELWGWQYEALGYVLNEIFARHGYHFSDTGRYLPYFSDQDWYRESTRYAKNEDILQKELTSTEWYNEHLVKVVRDDMKAIGTTNPTGKSIFEADRSEYPFDFMKSDFYGGQKLAVYSGPGEAYYRGANGRASVSTDDDIFVAGREGDWALVQYYTSGGACRVGYIDLDQLQYTLKMRVLGFEYVDAEITKDCTFTEDTKLVSTQITKLREGERVTLLGEFSERRDWAYIEAWVGERPARGFVPIGCVSRGSSR